MTALGAHAAATDPGRKRRRNEDAYVVQPPLFGVADGMGGAQAGEIASQIAAAVLQDSPGDADGAGTSRVVGLIQEANRRVYEQAGADDALAGMGTTMTVALVEGDVVHIGHVGDSRAYLVRERKVEQLTEDHSLVAELVRSGKLAPEEADVHPQRSVITRALGTDPDVDVDAFTVSAAPGDLFMVCSDGLTSMVGDDHILATIERNRDDLRAAAKALVDAANKGGGEDNITVVLFEFAGDTATDAPTQTIPAAEPEAADEDTLDELDRVPAIDTMVVPPAQAAEWNEPQLRAPAPLPREDAPAEAAPPAPAPAAPVRRRRVSRGVLAVLALALVALVAGFVVWGLSRSYFVGATEDGRVAVYQGFPWDITGDVKLYRLRYKSRLLAVQLSAAERRELFGHDLVAYDTALRRVKRYEDEVVP